MCIKLVFPLLFTISLHDLSQGLLPLVGGEDTGVVSSIGALFVARDLWLGVCLGTVT